VPLIYEPSPNSGALRQGEILGGIHELRPLHPAVAVADGTDVEYQLHRHPIMIVMTAECDLVRDYEARFDEPEELVPEVDHPRLLPHLLLCEVYEHSRIRGRVGATDLWKRAVQNQDERYHHLLAAPIWLSDLYMDFKKTLSLPTESLYAGIENGGIHRLAVVAPIYIHDLMHRFYGFLSRVGVP
jgi:hypothetical protein